MGKILKEEKSTLIEFLVVIAIIAILVAILPPSAIGKPSIMARQRSNEWFLAILNGPAAIHLPSVDISFMGDSEYRTILLTSKPPPQEFSRKVFPPLTAASPLPLTLSPSDGAMLWYRPLRGSYSGGRPPEPKYGLNQFSSLDSHRGSDYLTTITKSKIQSQIRLPGRRLISRHSRTFLFSETALSATSG